MGTRLASLIPIPLHFTQNDDGVPTMTIREVPQTDWIAFFDQFSRRHVNDPVTIEVEQNEANRGVIAESMPLQGITAGADPGSNTIEIIVAQAADEDLISHTVATPLHVRVDETGDEENTVEIEADDGTKTRVVL